MSRAEEIQHLFNSSLMLGRQKIEKWFGWFAPVWPWCKLNTDEACKQLKVSSVGGLIRDYNVGQGVLYEYWFLFCYNG